MTALGVVLAQERPQTVVASPVLVAVLAIVLVALVVGIFLVLRSIDRRDR